MSSTLTACDQTITRRVEHGRLLLENGAWEELRASREIYGELLLRLPLPLPGLAVLGVRRLAVPPDPPLAAATIVAPAELLGGSLGELSALRVLRSERESPCCGSRHVLELVGDDLVLRAWAHRLSPGVPEELSSLRGEYPPQPGPAVDACEWQGRLVDPLDASALLVQGVAGAAGGAPRLHVLWADAGGRPRGWETFGSVPEPNALHVALEVEPRYATRDEPAELIVDSSASRPPGGSEAAASEEVRARPFDRPAFEWLDATGAYDRT